MNLPELKKARDAAVEAHDRATATVLGVAQAVANAHRRPEPYLPIGPMLDRLSDAVAAEAVTSAAVIKAHEDVIAAYDALNRKVG